uniref:Uncharacterized protein n=2 Tax=Setaria viridis TaxID=4556 RepID=A0A4U6TUA7_SETVI|nr:hypothetical protein SEVIR_7G253800v2 [Setaria viridis]
MPCRGPAHRPRAKWPTIFLSLALSSSRRPPRPRRSSPLPCSPSSPLFSSPSTLRPLPMPRRRRNILSLLSLSDSPRRRAIRIWGASSTPPAAASHLRRVLTACSQPAPLSSGAAAAAVAEQEAVAAYLRSGRGEARRPGWRRCKVSHRSNSSSSCSAQLPASGFSM